MNSRSLFALTAALGLASPALAAPQLQLGGSLLATSPLSFGFHGHHRGDLFALGGVSVGSVTNADVYLVGGSGGVTVLAYTGLVLGLDVGSVSAYAGPAVGVSTVFGGPSGSSGVPSALTLGAAAGLSFGLTPSLSLYADGAVSFYSIALGGSGVQASPAGISGSAQAGLSYAIAGPLSLYGQGQVRFGGATTFGGSVGVGLRF